MGTDACIGQIGKLMFLQKQNYKTITTLWSNFICFVNRMEP